MCNRMQTRFAPSSEISVNTVLAGCRKYPPRPTQTAQFCGKTIETVPTAPASGLGAPDAFHIQFSTRLVPTWYRSNPKCTQSHGATQLTDQMLATFAILGSCRKR